MIERDNIGATSAYNLAFHTLQSLRSELVAMNQDVQFTFRDRVAPVYREYVNLLLNSPNPTQANLKQARQVIEALQLAELHNFFRQDCLEAKPEQIDQIIDKKNTESAVFYGIILQSDGIDGPEPVLAREFPVWSAPPQPMSIAPNAAATARSNTSRASV